jgi:hypothetical protein
MSIIGQAIAFGKAASMTQSQAFWKAVDLFGEGATAGHGVVGKDSHKSFFVGRKTRGDWTHLGKSEMSFDEAFENVREIAR